MDVEMVEMHIDEHNKIAKICVEDVDGYFEEYWVSVNELGHLVIESVVSGDLRVIDGPDNGTIILY